MYLHEVQQELWQKALSINCMQKPLPYGEYTAETQLYNILITAEQSSWQKYQSMTPVCWYGLMKL